MLLEQQKLQHEFDIGPGADMLPDSSSGRLKSFGLRLTIIVGRLLGRNGGGDWHESLVAEAFSIALSSANMLRINLENELASSSPEPDERPFAIRLADHVGQYADAAEKTDHLEELVAQAKWATVEITKTLLDHAHEQHFDLFCSVEEFRSLRRRSSETNIF